MSMVCPGLFLLVWVRLLKLWQPLGVGGLTLANGSSAAIVNGWSTVPAPQLSVASMPPTAAMGLAVTVEEPKAIAASIETELVIIPQPRLTFVLPPALIPVVAALMRL